MQKTTLARKGELVKEWFQFDANGAILGRLADKVAMVLMGKHKPTYTPHVDTGDFVVVTNAAKVRVTGRKAQAKEYDYYTYFPGGRKVIPYTEMLAKKPERIIIEAVRRMLPKSQLGRHMLTKLKVYRGPEHPHTAQQPQVMS